MRKIIQERNAQSSDFANDKVARWIFDTITGPGVKKRIKRDAARPTNYPGNDGILFLPEWQDDVLELSARPKKALLGMKRDETKMEAGAGAPKYPHIKVQLTEKDRSPYRIMGEVNHALRRAGLPKEERDKFFAEAIASAYPGVLQTAVKWVSVFDVSGLDESNRSSERHAVP